MTSLARAAAALFALAALVTPANAHSHLKSSTPANGEVLAVSPDRVALEFPEGVELKFSGLKVTNAAHGEAKLGAATQPAGRDSTLEVPLSEPLAAGDYTVDWHVLSKDGHKMKGSFKFSIRP